MVPKVYTLIWLLMIAAAVVLYFTGNFNDIVVTIFGFIFSTLLLVFFVGVLPWLMDKHYAWKY